MSNLSIQLLRDEGEVLTAYTDTLGFLTIGVGRLIDKRRGGGITQDESAYLLANDIKRKTQAVFDALPWAENLDEARQGVLINMAFQLGINGLLDFKNTLQFIKDKDYTNAAIGMGNSLWAKQTPARCVRLQKQIITGVWQ